MYLTCLVYLLLTTIPPSIGISETNPDNVEREPTCLIENFPYVVSIRMRTLVYHLCGGSLVNGLNVLTAAHCFVPYVRYVVVAGQSQLYGYWGIVQIQPVRKTFLHPHYDPQTASNDIAIFRLQAAIKQTVYTQYVKLPVTRSPSPCVNLTVAGWGNLNRDALTSILPLNFECASLSLVLDSFCRGFYDHFLPQIQLCTMKNELSNETTKNAMNSQCSGDIGSPVMCAGVQYGVVSSASNCSGLAALPQVHANVSEYLGFIKEAILSAAPHVTLSSYWLLFYIVYCCYV